ncbi:programmed cell death 6 protein [Trypanosoma rangeli]|uniref:Programmed cell death 6 protein n=1 Tax=Trypanosoma rangeli TaxID=5698 RepID=A0A422P491_TRYRA|nr:programmed cell death 6 protein [Trypanosoma rangeli]RNF12536.1 programmed cell death 6 protein [Trypanosoma rangeli]|eukprot:RNF12536.1 programmed cell death 6 protein [Trypanosoma rangeli]
MAYQPPYAHPYPPGFGYSVPPPMQPPPMQPPSMQPPSMQPPSMQPPSMQPPSMQPPSMQPPPMQPPSMQPIQRPPLGTEQDALQWFQMVSRSSGGRIGVPTLNSALSVGGHSFSYATTERLLSMFDSNVDGMLNLTDFLEFQRYFQTMRDAFNYRDTSRSSRLEGDEVRAALSAHAYQISDEVFQYLMRRFDRRKQGALGLDDYIEMSLFVAKANDVFQAESQGKATATFDFGTFLKAGVFLV